MIRDIVVLAAGLYLAVVALAVTVFLFEPILDWWEDWKAGW